MNTGSGLSWSLSGGGISLHGDWHYKYRIGFIKISDGGSFDVDVSGLSVSLTVTFGASSTGEPTIRSTDCSCNIDDLSLHLHGGASWFYDLFVRFVENPIKSNLEHQLCNAARKSVDEDASRELATLQVQVIIDKQWLFDYRLVSAPTFGAGYLESNHKGEFFFAGQQTEAPFQPPVIPSPSVADRMLLFEASDYLFNTAGYVLHQHNVLAYNLTQKDLPDDQKVYLNTTCCPSCKCVGKLVPAVAKNFPNASVEAFMFSTEPPFVSIDSSSAFGNFSGAIDLFARLSNNSLAHLFKIEATARVAVVPSFDGSVLRAKVNGFNETIHVVDSSIGTVSDGALKIIFGLFETAFIIPQLNKAGAKGFPLPHLDYVRFVNTGLQLMANSVSLYSDVQYMSNTLYFEP